MTKGKPANVPIETSEGKGATSLFHPWSDMERVFERLFGRSWPAFWGHEFPAFDTLAAELDHPRLPNLDIIDQDNEIVVRAEMPGIDKKDVSVSLTDNLLTIKGETRKESRDEKGDYHRREISRASFARTVALPANVDASRAGATLQDGVLEIRLTKAESSRRRTITVQ
ncbi:MAG TPA: Hsp20/alpha crystallin family protein [Methylophilaceae bacterium]|jgi:HSP20 family protein